MLPKVSIIIVNYNGKRFLKECFFSLKKSDYSNLEIIMVDNASTDGSIAFARENYPDLVVIKKRKNHGFAKASNDGADKADGKYLFFLNNDTKLGTRTVSLLVKAMEKDTRLGICGPKMVSYDGRKHFHTGIGIDIFGFPTNTNRVFYAEGAALMIRRDLFNRLDGFDPDYFMFHEDIDLGWRAWLLGYRVAAVPQAVVYHFIGGTAKGNISSGKYTTTFLRRSLSERNNLRTLFKNYSLITLILVLPLYLLINLGEILFFLLTLRPKAAYSYLNAYGWNLSKLKETFKKRARIQQSRKISDSQLVRKMYKGSGKLLALKKVGIPLFE